MYRLLIPLCMCSAIIVMGCTQPESIGMEPIARDTASAEPEFEQVSVRPVLWDRSTPPWGKELLAEPALMSLTAASTESAWKIYSAYKATYRIDDEAPPEAVDVVGYEGMLRVSNTGPFSLSQTIADIPTGAQERWIEASVWARSQVPGAVSLSIRHSSDQDLTIRERHGGSGWEKLTIAGPYLWANQRGSIVFSVVRREQGIHIDIAQPSLRILDEHPRLRVAATGDPNQLLVNAGFDQFADSDLPFPWRFNFWRGDPGEVRIAWKDANDPSKGRVVMMTQPKGSMRLFQRLPVFTATDAGKAYTAKIDAIAGKPQELRLNLRVSKPNGGDLEDLGAYVDHPGDGAWRTLEAKLALPADKSRYPLLVSFEIIRRNTDTQPIVIDNASFRLE